MKLRSVASALLAGALFVPVGSWAALDPIPTTSGWSGSFILGAGWTEVESNLIAGNKFADIGKEQVDSIFDGPESEDDVIPVFSGDVRYTFGESQTQLFVGSDVADLVRFDFSNLLGVRKQFNGVGTMGLALAVSSFPTELWEDPYLEGVNRKETDRDSTGIRFDWSRMLDSNFSFKFNYRDIDIDKERSGSDPALGLTDQERRLLRRDGENMSYNLEYLWKIGPRQVLIPEIFYTNRDRDGDAVTSDTVGGNLTWSYLGDTWTFVLTGSLAASEYDKRNPIYNEKADEDIYSLGATAFYKLPTRSNRWSVLASAAYGDSDSDIDFHDTTITLISAGVRYRFGDQR